MNSADQPTHAALRLLDQRPELFQRQGAVVASWRQKRGRTFGPYYQLIYREDRRQRSIYLGRQSPLVDQVRRRVEELQRPFRQGRAMEQERRRASASLRESYAGLRRQLALLGLRTHGREVRGWRNCGLPEFVKNVDQVPGGRDGTRRVPPTMSGGMRRASAAAVYRQSECRVVDDGTPNTCSSSRCDIGKATLSLR